jgi:hypothetical protein
MESTGEALDSARATASIGRSRLAIGLFQGVVAWLLLRLVAPSYPVASAVKQTHAPYWASQHPMAFAALALITAYVPLIAIAEIGRMRRRMLVIYLGMASAIVAGLAAYDIWRDPIQYWGGEPGSRVWPSFTVSFCTTLGLFIANQLLEHRERGNTLFTHYADYFEDSWMRAFQLVLSIIFALLVWALLELGGELFHLIHLEWFQTMIAHNWFRCPALAVAFAAAVHITDVRPALLTGVRNVGLTLFSWLLPIVVTLGAGFVVALAFVGVKPLWATNHAASILLWACAITVMLLNAAYKDGDPSNLPPAVLRWTGRMAGPVALALALLGSYAIGLRVYQHGWTPERVFSAAVAFMAVVYGAGYTYASVLRKTWLAPLASVNVAASLLILGILALVLSPAADPARLSVNSQLRRLTRGEILPGKFDYGFLRFESGRFGTEALARLADDANDDVRERAARVQQTRTRTYHAPGEPDPAVSEPAFSHATVYPRDARLPDDFRSTNFPKTSQVVPLCMRDGTPCDIYILPYGALNDSAIIVSPHKPQLGERAPYFVLEGHVFQRDREGKWIHIGTLAGMGCPNIVAALRDGKVTTVRPEYDDLLVDGVRIHFSSVPRVDNVCAKESSPKPENRQDKPRDADAPVQMGPAFGKP